jgi:hypothetical protein
MTAPVGGTSGISQDSLALYKRTPEGKFCIGDYARDEFAYLRSCDWVFTEKVDGTNIRVMWDNATGEVTFGGKTDRAQIPTALNARLQELFPKARFEFGNFPDAMILYGEGYGGNIQKGKLYHPTPDFILFDIRVGKWWLRRDDIVDVAQKLNIEVVPRRGCGSLDDMETLIRDGVRSVWGDFLAEGLVARPAVELCTRGGQRIITKLKHCDFGVNTLPKGRVEPETP